jgi:predicted metal-dependent phosphoesterase TrpH
MNKTQYKIDLHTHSIISHDGGIKALEYEKILTTGVLDCVAVTDHNETSFARILHKKLGDRIIIGEEITSIDGEIIGLYLQKNIEPGLSAQETVHQIHQQHGLVYIPHPLEKFRKGLQKKVLESIISDVDIIEVFNGRGLIRNRIKETLRLAENESLIKAASSDAHCHRGLGYSYSTLTEFPFKDSLKELLKDAELSKKYSPFYTYICPFINRLKNKILLTND